MERGREGVERGLGTIQNIRGGPVYSCSGVCDHHVVKMNRISGQIQTNCFRSTGLTFSAMYAMCALGTNTVLIPYQVGSKSGFLLNKKTRLLVQPEDMPSCPTRKHASCCTRRYVFLSNKRTCFCVAQEGMHSCSTRRHVFLLKKRTCLLADQEDMSSC